MPEPAGRIVVRRVKDELEPAEVFSSFSKTSKVFSVSKPQNKTLFIAASEPLSPGKISCWLKCLNNPSSQRDTSGPLIHNNCNFLSSSTPSAVGWILEIR